MFSVLERMKDVVSVHACKIGQAQIPISFYSLERLKAFEKRVDISITINKGPKGTH